MKKEEKDKLFNMYKGYAINTAVNLWNSWELRHKASLNYLSKEDIIQEAFIKLLSIVEKIDTTKEDKQIIFFVNQSIKNHILNEFRKVSGEKRMGSIEHSDIESLIAKPEYEESIQKKIVLEFFDRININEKKYISLILDGISSSDAQEKLGWTEKTRNEKVSNFNSIIKGILDEYKS